MFIFNFIHIQFQASGKELERKSRKLRWKEFIETPELDDQDEKKAEELQRLITLWRTSDKRQEMYKDMENMEVTQYIVPFLLCLSNNIFFINIIMFCIAHLRTFTIPARNRTQESVTLLYWSYLFIVVEIDQMLSKGKTLSFKTL